MIEIRTVNSKIQRENILTPQPREPCDTCKNQCAKKKRLGWVVGVSHVLSSFSDNQVSDYNDTGYNMSLQSTYSPKK